VDCASKGTLASGMGVGAGAGFAGDPEACWLGAIPPLETKTRIISKTIRITGCIERKRGSESAAHSAWFIDPKRGVEARSFLCGLGTVDLQRGGRPLGDHPPWKLSVYSPPCYAQPRRQRQPVKASLHLMVNVQPTFLFCHCDDEFAGCSRIGNSARDPQPGANFPSATEC
jgi:hypothetical protein